MSTLAHPLLGFGIMLRHLLPTAVSLLLAVGMAACGGDAAEDPAGDSAGAATSEAALVAPIPPVDGMCGHASNVSAQDAAWMGWFSANAYSHLSVVGPALVAAGFGNPGDGAAWVADFKALLAARAARSPNATHLEDLLVRSVHEDRKIDFFSGPLTIPGADNERGSTQVTVAAHGTLPVAVIAFRGTEKDEKADIASDLSFFRQGSDVTGVPGQVHGGFFSAEQEVEARLMARVALLPANTTIYITGHSLGAALATVFAARLVAAKTPHRLALYTFGSPRVGDHQFATELSSSFQRSGFPAVRFHRSFDPVASLPPAIVGFEHVGTPVRLTSDAWEFDNDDSPFTTRAEDHAMGGYCQLGMRFLSQSPPYACSSSDTEKVSFADLRACR